MGKEGAEYFGDVLMKNTYLTDVVSCKVLSSHVVNVLGSATWCICVSLQMSCPFTRNVIPGVELVGVSMPRLVLL